MPVLPRPNNRTYQACRRAVHSRCTTLLPASQSCLKGVALTVPEYSVMSSYYISSKIVMITTRILLSWRCNQFTPISPGLSRVSRVPKDECGCKDQRSSTHHLHYREEPAGPEVAMTDRCNEYEFKRNHNVGCQQRGVDIWYQERKCM